MKRRIFSPRIIFPLTAFGLAGAAFFSLWLSVSPPQPRTGIPERLGDLVLVSLSNGPEAITRVNGLYGTEIEISDALIAEYETKSYQSGASLTIWVGTARTNAEAAQLTMLMVEAIRKGYSPFSNLRQVTVSDTVLFQVDGPSGDHFFYISRLHPESIVWISIVTPDPHPILMTTLKAF